LFGHAQICSTKFFIKMTVFSGKNNLKFNKNIKINTHNKNTVILKIDIY
jgi:hypothetical protein